MTCAYLETWYDYNPHVRTAQQLTTRARRTRSTPPRPTYLAPLVILVQTLCSVCVVLPTSPTSAAPHGRHVVVVVVPAQGRGLGEQVGVFEQVVVTVVHSRLDVWRSLLGCRAGVLCLKVSKRSGFGIEAEVNHVSGSLASLFLVFSFAHHHTVTTSG